MEENLLAVRAHECPVPKPGGLVGRILGFGKVDERDEEVRSRGKVEGEGD